MSFSGPDAATLEVLVASTGEVLTLPAVFFDYFELHEAA